MLSHPLTLLTPPMPWTVSYRRKLWDSREKDRLCASWSEVKMAEGKQGANIGGNIGAGAGILAKRFQKSMNRAQEKVGGCFFVFWELRTLALMSCCPGVCILCVGIQRICSKMFRGLRKTGTNVHKICKYCVSCYSCFKWNCVNTKTTTSCPQSLPP